VGLIPWLLTGWQAVREPVPYWVPMRVLGVMLLVAGLITLIQAFVRFVVEGRGTPAHLIRDAPLMLVVLTVSEPFFKLQDKARDVLTVGWGARGKRRELLLGALRGALDFQTRRSFAGQQGLNDEQAVELMVGLVRCLMHD